MKDKPDRLRTSGVAPIPVSFISPASYPYAPDAAIASRPEKRSAGGLPPASLRQPIGGRTKRVVDICVASLALVVALPLMIMVALAIKMNMGGSVIYSHPRVGFRGRPFNCYKFRTMVPDSERVLREYLAAHPEAAAEWAERRKLGRDPRVTFLGRMLRVSSLDELPQLFNVLRGDMSCVGPRPIVSDELELYGDVAAHYLRARPGLTGIWQVSGRDNLGYPRRVQLDLDYLTNWSLATDAAILFRTIFVVMKIDDAS